MYALEGSVSDGERKHGGKEGGGQKRRKGGGREDRLNTPLVHWTCYVIASNHLPMNTVTAGGYEPHVHVAQHRIAAQCYPRSQATQESRKVIQLPLLPCSPEQASIPNEYT